MKSEAETRVMQLQGTEGQGRPQPLGAGRGKEGGVLHWGLQKGCAFAGWPFDVRLLASRTVQENISVLSPSVLGNLYGSSRKLILSMMGS